MNQQKKDLVFLATMPKYNILSEQEKFMNIDSDFNITETPEIAQYKQLYQNIIEKHREDFETLIKLEEIITQLRCKELAKNDVKLSDVNGYIYARAPFYVIDRKSKDIRAIVGKTEQYGNDLNKLLKDKKFMSYSKSILISSMDKLIIENISKINIDMLQNILSLPQN